MNGPQLAKDEVSLNFDRIARPYRWLEYCSFGRLLEHCRFAQLPHLGQAGCALVLGDGDGRFLARLVRENFNLQVDLVDISKTMLDLAMGRIPAGSHVRPHCADIRHFQPPAGRTYDLVITHFFLDCLTEAEIMTLLHRLRSNFAIRTTWVVSEFDVPSRGLARALGWVLIRALYAMSRLLTGLRVHHLPVYRPLLAEAGFAQESTILLLRGILRSERWSRLSPAQATESPRNDSQ